MTPEEANEWLDNQAHPYIQGSEARVLGMLRAFSYEEREITLASGAKSNFYVDCRRTLLIPEGQKAAALALHMAVYRAEWLRPSEYTPAGSGLGGSVLAGAVGYHRICAGHIIVRKKAKEHGTQNRIEAAPDVYHGANVIIFDDVATSGGSALDVAACLTEGGYHVRGVAVLVDRQEGAAEAFDKASIPFLALFTPEDFRS